MYHFITDGHSTESMEFIWKNDAVSVAKYIQFPQFALAEITPYTCDKNYYGSKPHRLLLILASLYIDYHLMPRFIKFIPKKLRKRVGRQNL